MKTVEQLDRDIIRLKSDFSTLSDSIERHSNPKAKRVLKDRCLDIAERLRRAGIDRLLAQRREGIDRLKKQENGTRL